MYKYAKQYLFQSLLVEILSLEFTEKHGVFMKFRFIFTR